MSKIINIAHVVSANRLDRYQRFIDELSVSVRALDIKCQVIPLSDDDLRVPFRHAVNLARKLRHDKVDVVQTHDGLSLKLGTLAACFAMIPAVHTQHEVLTEKLPTRMLFFNRQTVAVSERVKESLVKYHPLAAKRIRVIAHAINQESLVENLSAPEQQDLRRSLGLRVDSLLIANAEALVASSDQMTLLKAFAKLVHKKVNAQLVLSGEGPQKVVLEKFIGECGLKDHVRFLASGEGGVAGIFNICDTYVSAAFAEDVPYYQMEAMAHGKPVITTKIGTYADVVEDGKSGYLVPCGFPERIESALMRFYARRSHAEDLGDAARVRARAMFDMTKIAMAYEDVYRQ